ncbi:MAG: uroporphyrinogen-III synthase [Thermoprotei archaeon]
MWAILGTGSTSQKVVAECKKLGLEARAYAVVDRVVNPKISQELSPIYEVDCQVYTSPQAARLVAVHAGKATLENLRHVTAYAIGSATSSEVSRVIGPPKIIVAQPQNSEGLVASLGNTIWRESVLFASMKRSQVLSEHLRRNSLRYHEPRLYDLTLSREECRRFELDLNNGVVTGAVFTCSTAVGAIPEKSMLADSFLCVAMGQRTLSAIPRSLKAVVLETPSVESVAQKLVNLKL